MDLRPNSAEGAAPVVKRVLVAAIPNDEVEQYMEEMTELPADIAP